MLAGASIENWGTSEVEGVKISYLDLVVIFCNSHNLSSDKYCPLAMLFCRAIAK
jgi:hypothetical protein